MTCFKSSSRSPREDLCTLGYVLAEWALHQGSVFDTALRLVDGKLTVRRKSRIVLQ